MSRELATLAAGAALVVTLGGCAQPAPRPPAPPAPPVAGSPPSEGPAVATEVTITETTIADVADLRVGVGNAWEADFQGEDGRPQRGPTAMVSFDRGGQTLHRERVHVGQTLAVGGHRFRIVRVNAPAGERGSVTVELLDEPTGTSTPAPTSGGR